MLVHNYEVMNDEQPTAKQTNSFQRAPIFKAMALDLADRLDAVALRKTHVLHEIDVRAALDARVLAKEARLLAFRFEAWMQGDVPPDQRRTDHGQLEVLTEAARRLGVSSAGTAGS